MNDVVRYEPPAPRERAWIELAPQAAELAKTVAGTDFVPAALRNNAPAITAAILYGDEVGLGPMQSLSKVHVIDGRPALAAESQRALILALGHDIWLEAANTTAVTWAAKRRGSDNTTRITWNMDDAKKAGLDGRQNWRKYPRAMLSARASAELARAVFPDVLGGLAALEELEDPSFLEEQRTEDDANAAPPPPVKTPAKRTRAKRGTGKDSAPARVAPPVVAEDLPPLPGDEDDTGPAIPFPNHYAMKAKEAGLGDDARHALTAMASDGRTTRSAELERPEEGRVLNWVAAIDRGELALEEEEAGDWLLYDVDRKDGAEFISRWMAPDPATPAENEAPNPAPGVPSEPDPGESAPDTADDEDEASDELEEAEVIVTTVDELRDLMKSKGKRVSDVIRKAGEGIDGKFAPADLGGIIEKPTILATVVEWLNAQ